jgi:hypothetical protein
MRLAITDHAVQRYVERAQGAKDLSTGSVRMLIQEMVEDAHCHGKLRDHPTESGKQIIPFKSGQSTLYLSLGPNKTQFPGDVAVISVLYDKELGGKIEMGVTLGEALPALKTFLPADKAPPKYIVKLSGETTEVRDEEELRKLLQEKQPKPEKLLVYELKRLKVKVEYVVEGL